MSVREVHPDWLPPDTLLRAELDALDEDAAPEMTNLPESRTGVPGWCSSLPAWALTVRR